MSALKFRLPWYREAETAKALESTVEKSATSSPQQTIITASEQSDSKLRAFLDRLGMSTVSFRNKTEDFVKYGYVQNIDVFSIIRQIAQTSSSVPWAVWEQNSKGEKVELFDTELHQLMKVTNKEKGRNWASHQLESLSWMLISGNSYETKQESAGFGVSELDILYPQFTTVEVSPNANFFNPLAQYIFQFEGTYKFDQEEIIHTKTFNPNVYGLEDMFYGLSPLAAAIMVIKTGNERWIANAHVIENKGQIGILTNKSEYPLPPKEVEKMQQEGLEHLGGADKFGRVFWSNKNLDFLQIGMSSMDLQLLDTDPATIRAICNAFGVDSSMFNDPANKRFNNIQEADKRFITRAVQPLLKKKEDQYAMDLVKQVMGRDNIVFAPDYRGVEALEKDKKAEADRYRGLVERGILTAEQAAIELGYEYQGTTDPVAANLASLPISVQREVIGRMTDQQVLDLIGLRFEGNNETNNDEGSNEE